MIVMWWERAVRRGVARRWARALCGVLLAAWSSAAAASVLDLPWPRQLGRGEAVPGIGIRSMAEDTAGYLWMASNDGLLRFDGRRVRVWRQEEGLIDATLHTLHVDARDRLWLGTASRGLLMMPAQRDRFERPGPDAPAALRSGGIAGIASGRDGAVWVIGADRGLYRQRADDPRWQRVDAGAGAVTALTADRDGHIWVGTTQGLRRLHDGQLHGVGASTAAVLALWADPAGGLHVEAADAAYTVDRQARVHRPLAAGRPLLRSDDGALWLQQETGLVLHRHARVQPIPLRPLYGPRSDRVVMQQALQDRQGDIWLLSRAHGLWRLPAHWRAFTALPSARDGLPGLRSHYALALAGAADGRLWVVGSHGRLQRLDLRTGASSDHLDYAHAGFSATAVGMAEDARGRLWIASGGQMLRYDPARRTLRRWPLGLAGGQAALSLQACADGSLWLAHPDQIQQWTPQGVRRRVVAPQSVGLAAGMAARQLLCDHGGRLWATDRHGLRYWDATGARFVAAEASNTAVAAIAEAADGSLWLSRQDALERHRWDGRGLRRTQRFDAAAGYPQVRAEALAVDAHGMVWAGAARGLIRLDPTRGQVRVLGSADGLPAQEMLGQRLVRLRSGVLAAAVREGGLLLHEPGSLPRHRALPRLQVDAVRVPRGAQTRIFRPSAEPIVLASSDRNIQVAVNLLGRGDPDRIQYRFRLQGRDREWIDTGPVAQRIFAQLAVGEHRLSVQGRHGDGPWSAPSSLVLTVVPAWWQRGSGRVALAVLGLLALGAGGRMARGVLAVRRQRRQQREQHRRAERDSAERTRFLGQLGHRIRLPMTAVSGWSELLLEAPLAARQREPLQSLHQAGLHLVQLVDDALDLASIEAGRLHLQPVAFAPAALLQELHALLQPVAQARSLQLAWASTLAPHCWLRGDVCRLRQILLNLVGNALKFTPRGTVQVTACAGPAGAGLILGVTDTGPGMTRAQVQRLFRRFEQAEGADTFARHGGSGLGLAISRELAQAMGGEITVESRPGHGTRFQVWLPLPAAPAPGMSAVPACGHAHAPAPPLRRPVLLVWQGDTAEVIAALLEAQGLEVACVDPADAALAAAPDTPWALLVADPDQRVGAEPIGMLLPRRWPGVPRLALTARADAAAERDALAAGFSVFLRLPLARARLSAALAQCWAAR
ncbi:Autoinducer 2 sensor kinase/phosphatase LuxQ [compost metagenome]